jgi:N-formylglutamate amidohydrolase
MDGPVWEIQFGEGPLVAAAIHSGHAVRSELADLLALGEAERRYEEDPFTDAWASVAPTRIVLFRSRFELDLNRPREKAVYRQPEDAWGLRVWKRRLPGAVVERSLAQYDAFYRQVRFLLEGLVERFGRVVVFDLHTYNHRRLGADAPAADPQQNPEVNVGTGTMDRRRWGPVVDRFVAELGDFDFLGRRLDVRENVKFQGGHFSRWIHRTFPHSVCSLAVEVKKFFMDEWTGEVETEPHRAVEQALGAAAAGMLEELQRL